MADPVLIKRLTRLLEETSEATPKGEGFWATLAAAAADEAARALTIQQLALPVEPFLVAIRAHEGLRTVASSPTLGGASQAAMSFLEERGIGEALIVEVRRVLGVA